MREILFRGKRVDNGEWVYGSFHKKFESCFIIPLPIITSQSKVDPATVGQYTGLTANGRQIFEGDIVIEYTLSGEIFAMGPVEWSDTFVGWQVGDKSMYSESLSRYQVIGDVHDPEIVDVSEEVQ